MAPLPAEDGLGTIPEYGGNVSGSPQLGSPSRTPMSLIGARSLNRWSLDFPASVTTTSTDLPVSYADETSSLHGLQYNRAPAGAMTRPVRGADSQRAGQSPTGAQLSMPVLRPIRVRPPARPAQNKGVFSQMLMGCIGGRMPED